MNDATLEMFRQIASEMQGAEPQDWQWVGRWESQRMFGLSETRAKHYAATYGGEASQMQSRGLTK